MMEPFLHRVPMFKPLPPAERKRLARVAQEKSFAKGETVFRQGQPADALWIVKRGRVHLMYFLPDGKASTTCVMTAGEPFCCLPALDGKPYPVDAMAAEDTVVVKIPLPAFHQAMNRSPGFTHEALCLFCDRLRQVEHKSCMIYEPAEARLAQVLIGLMKKFGATIPLTRQELAEVAGTTHETAIRTLSSFRKQGLVKSTRGHTTILAADKLQALAERA